MKTIMLKNALSHQAEIVMAEKARPLLNDERQVLIRVICVGLDGTDREIITESYGIPPEGEKDLVIGHELLGVVEEAGAATDFRPGDAVTVLVRRPCQDPDCLNCAAGRSDFCQTGNYIERGIRGSHGFMCEYVVEDAAYVVKVPAELGELGVWVEPQSIFEKVWSEIEHIQRRMIWQPKRVLVLGSGPLGLLTALSLRTMGLETHVWSKHAQDSFQAKLLTEIGAQYCCSLPNSSPNAGNRGLVEYYSEQLSIDFDLILECTGYSPLAFEASQLLRTNGIIGLLGVTPGNLQVEVPVDRLNLHFVMGNRCMVGSVNASRHDFIQAIARLQEVERKYPGDLNAMLTDRLSPEQVASVDFARIDVKAVVCFSKLHSANNL